MIDKKMGCPQEGEGHPYKRVSMVPLYITKMVRHVNGKNHYCKKMLKKVVFVI